MHLASWVALIGVSAVFLALAAAIGISVAAFVQGRELSLWPPRIGQRPLPSDPRRADIQLTSTYISTLPESARPDASGASGVVRAYRKQQVSLPNRNQLFDQEFTVERSAQFYELIAPHYDERNTRDLVITHRETVLRLKKIRNERSSLRVLDLGGGTGIHIAQAFFDEQDVSWDYVDHSVAMLSQFRQNFVNTPLFSKVRIHLDDMVNVLPRLSTESYDVVLLSLVLSSMPSIPDFRELIRLVAPGGALVISDIDPSYTSTHPHYAVQVDGFRYALRTQPINPLDLVKRARAHGFHTDDLVSIVNNKTDYSFLGVFRARTTDSNA